MAQAKKGRTSISGTVDSKIWAEFVKAFPYFGFSKPGAIDKAIKDFTEKLKKNGGKT